MEIGMATGTGIGMRTAIMNENVMTTEDDVDLIIIIIIAKKMMLMVSWKNGIARSEDGAEGTKMVTTNRCQETQNTIIIDLAATG